MKEIKLTKGYVAFVDDEDYDNLIGLNWYACQCNKKVYARASLPNDKKVFMHRYLLECMSDREIDHKDGNGLNNQRVNLRECTRQQNACNRSKSKNTTSVYLGVSWRKERSKWRAGIKKNDKYTHLGYFNSECDAAIAYNNAAKSLNGEFANLNTL